MKVTELVTTNKVDEYLNTVVEYCSDFLLESNKKPIFRNIPKNYQDFKRVKVRKKKNPSEFSTTFNEAFKDELIDLRERSIFASGNRPTPTSDMEPYYIFPIDGYSFLYDKKITKSTDVYETELGDIISTMDDTGKSILIDLFKLSYDSTNLHEGISSGAEIIIYGIPYFYTMRVSLMEDYENTINKALERKIGV